MQFVKNIIYSILSLQEKFLRYKLSGTIGVKQNSKRKKHFSDGCTLDLNTLADKELEQLEGEITNILKTYDYEPEKLLQYIENQGTKVFRLNNSSNILHPLGESEGFILPAKGFKALYFALSLNLGFKLKTDEMFVLSKKEINKYYFIYHFYNWYALKNGIAGLDRESRELLQKFLFSDADTNNLQLSEIYKLKDAIKQDKVAIEFVIKLCRNYDGTKQALDKIKNNGSASL